MNDAGASGYSQNDLDRAITLLNVLKHASTSLVREKVNIDRNDASILLRLIDDRSFAMLAQERWDDLFMEQT